MKKKVLPLGRKRKQCKHYGVALLYFFFLINIRKGFLSLRLQANPPPTKQVLELHCNAGLASFFPFFFLKKEKISRNEVYCLAAPNPPFSPPPTLPNPPPPLPNPPPPSPLIYVVTIKKGLRQWRGGVRVEGGFGEGGLLALQCNTFRYHLTSLLPFF